MKFRRPAREREGIEINLASMIDVVFVLLLFFVVTSTFQRQTKLSVELPQSENSEAAPVQRKTLEISISADGKFAINGQPLARNDSQALRAALAKESGGDKELPLTISADGNTPHQAVVTAMDAAGQQGFSHLRISTAAHDDGR